jgi:hypothetical protein
VLDGSEDEGWIETPSSVYDTSNKSTISFQTSQVPRKYGNDKITLIADNFAAKGYLSANELLTTDIEIIRTYSSTSPSLGFCILKSKLSSQNTHGFQQWLQANPITVVYELAEPYYEDITPIQSQWVMSIFEESNLDIITSLPIKSNISYSVSILDTNSLEEELNEVITNKTDLTNLLEDEINN